MVDLPKKIGRNGRFFSFQSAQQPLSAAYSFPVINSTAQENANARNNVFAVCMHKSEMSNKSSGGRMSLKLFKQSIQYLLSHPRHWIQSSFPV